MASKFGLAGGIPERRVRPIWDAIDSRQFKNAFKHVTTLLAKHPNSPYALRILASFKHVTTLLAKHPNSPYALALKALILERMGKLDEAFSVCLNAKELLFTNDSLLMDDLTLSTLQIVFQRLDHLDLAASCYEHACSTFPNNLELMMGLFNCYVREYSFVKQQQTAIKMYKLVGEERFLLWAVCSIQLQVFCGNGGEKLLLLAEGLLKKHVASHGLHEPDALIVYLSILEQQAKFGDALEILSGNLGSLLMIEVDKLRIQGRLLARAGDHAAAAAIFKKILETCPDDWMSFLHYLGCLLEDDSIWCDEAVKDPVHPSKFISCKVSHLTDEEFDSQVSNALDFVQKLQADPLNNSLRGPYLATMEVERRKHLRGRVSDDSLMDAIVQYFSRFGHLPCFTSDVEIFIEVFNPVKKIELLEKLKENSDSLIPLSVKNLGQTFSFFKIQQLLMGEMFESSESELQVCSAQLAEIYCRSVTFSKDLDPQESMQGEDLLSIICNLLVQLFWRTKNVGYLMEAIIVLEFGLAIRRHVWQYKILLLHMYSYFGALSVAYEWYKSLDVKNILMETLSHHIYPQMLVSPLWTELDSLLKDYLKFMDDYLRESADLTFHAFRHRNYSKVIEFVQFKEQLQRSSQYLVARVEATILQLKQNSDDIEEEQGVLESLKCGIDFLELSNEIGSKSLTFLEDLQSRPWWTPMSEKNFLLEPFEGISFCPRRISTNERETSCKRMIEKRSLVPRLVYLSIQRASASVKENVEVNGSVPPKICSELKLLLERYAQLLGFSLREAADMIMDFPSGERFSEVVGPNLIDWLNFTVFLNAWNLSSHELVQPDEKESRPHTWSVLDSLLEKFILEKVRSMESEICSSWSDVQLLIQIVTEPLAWHGLVIQSCLRSCLPSGKKKKKSGSIDHSSSSLVHTITNSVQHLSSIIEEILKWTREWKNTPEDKNVAYIISSFRSSEQDGGPGQIFRILDSFFSAKDGAELGDRISQSLESWSPADVARKMVSGKHKVVMEFSKICESKLKSLLSMKQQIAQL